MTSPDNTAAGTAEVVSELTAIQLLAFTEYALMALAIYEFTLTLDDERKHLWRAKKSLVFVLFVCLRYCNLGTTILATFSNVLPLEATGCSVIIYAANVLDWISSASLSVLFILRAFAITNRNPAVLAVLLPTALAKLAIEAVNNFALADVRAVSGAALRYETCTQIPSDLPLLAKLETAQAFLVIAFDSVVLVLTIARTARTAIEFRRLQLRQGYSFFLLRDGLLYFLALEFLVISIAVFNQFPALQALTNIVQVLQPLLSSILGQRLVLSLKHVSTSLHRSLTTVSSANADSSVTSNSTILGNIGEPLVYERDDVVQTA